MRALVCVPLENSSHAFYLVCLFGAIANHMKWFCFLIHHETIFALNRLIYFVYIYIKVESVRMCTISPRDLIYHLVKHLFFFSFFFT